MNKRDYKEFGTGEWYHIFTRGNDKMNVFRDHQDYEVFLNRLSRVLGLDAGLSQSTGHGQGAPLTSTVRERIRVMPFERGAFTICAYCLMPNHFHFLIQQNSKIPISKLFLKVLTSYSMYFNRKYNHVGHVFQDRFKAVHIEDNTQLLHVSAYIHQNPKVARLVRDVPKWKYSSYPEYLQEKEGSICDKKIILEQFKNVREYHRLVEDAFDDIRARKSAVRDLMIDE